MHDHPAIHSNIGAITVRPSRRPRSAPCHRLSTPPPSSIGRFCLANRLYPEPRPAHSHGPTLPSPSRLFALFARMRFLYDHCRPGIIALYDLTGFAGNELSFVMGRLHVALGPRPQSCNALQADSAHSL